MGFTIEKGVLKRYRPEPGEIEAVIPEGITRIDTNAFSCQEELISVFIPDSVTKIGERAFADCKNLEHVHFSAHLQSIGYGAFSGCESLTELAFPDSVKQIESLACMGCERLTRIRIPAQLETLGEKVFDGTPWLADYPDDWVIVNGILVKYKASDAVSAVIPDGVTQIAACAFAECESLAQITVLETVRKIRYGAFYGTKWEEDSQGQWSIFNGILYACREYGKHFRIPSHVTSIGERAFSGYSYHTETIAFSENIISIGTWAFGSFRGTLLFTSGDITIAIPCVGGHWQRTESLRVLDFLCCKTQQGREKLFRSIRTAKYKAPLAILLLMRYDSKPAKDYIKTKPMQTLTALIAQDDAASLARVLELGIVTGANIDQCITYAVSQKALQCQTLLLHYKADVIGYSEDMFRL